MKDFNKKIARFVELSKEFTTKEHEVYEGFEPQQLSYGTLSVSASYSGDYGYVIEVPSKNIQYAIYLEQQLNKTRRYEEYKTLQASLSEYFEAVEKLSSSNENVEGRV